MGKPTSPMGANRMSESETSPKAVEELKEGDLVDLEGDQYADPSHDDGCAFPYEYAMVLGVDEETPECTRVDFDSTSVGFPHGYRLPVKRWVQGGAVQ